MGSWSDTENKRFALPFVCAVSGRWRGRGERRKQGLRGERLHCVRRMSREQRPCIRKPCAAQTPFGVAYTQTHICRDTHIEAESYNHIVVQE